MKSSNIRFLQLLEAFSNSCIALILSRCQVSNLKYKISALVVDSSNEDISSSQTHQNHVVASFRVKNDLSTHKESYIDKRVIKIGFQLLVFITSQ